MSQVPQEPSGPNRLPLLPGEPDPDAGFAQALRAARVAAGLTQREVADRMTGAGYQMHQTTIAKIEAGDRLAWLGEAVTLAEIVGVSLSDLVTGPPVPGELAEAIAVRAGYMRRRNQIAAQVEEIQKALAAAEHALADVGAAVVMADKKVESLMRRKGEVIE